MDGSLEDMAEVVIDYQIESQRGLFMFGYPFFSASALLPLDPAPFSSLDGQPLGSDLNTLETPDDTWEWVWPRWFIEMNHHVDDQGWCYAFRFKSERWYGGHVYLRSFVRRRVWKRPRRKISHRGSCPEPILIVYSNNNENLDPQKQRRAFRTKRGTKKSTDPPHESTNLTTN